MANPMANELSTNSVPTTAPQSCADLAWMRTWENNDPIPEEPEDKLAEVYSRLMYRLEPADEKAMAVALAKLQEFGRTFGIPADNVAGAVPYYRDALKHLPADFLMEAIAETCRTWKWGHKMPLPADVVANAPKEWLRRKLLMFAIRQKLRKMGVSVPMP